ncbi:LINE-1 retrotransposable element ORF2 protein [Vitis vinifera]|uniref:LINE-1 retrotransposable element ORF2 protein n=1 Tax=Vitis vinifera TaxID=29760 RepID=A0A438KI30_VITVI|nr:LINE-1 retrotransposable element ORF2 protein [Vitis vinifera]
MWLKVEGFKDLIHSWWQGIEGRGSASYRLATKMKEIKQKLKVWNREVFRRLEYNKVVALQLVDHWDLVESEKRLSEEETTSKKEAKESYAKIKINGVWLSEEKEVREGVANAYKYLLIENSDWKADIERLQLEQISQQEAENLEHPFFEDEIHSALMEMNGDKVSGPDGFTMAFWQSYWVLLKRRSWICLRSSMSKVSSSRVSTIHFWRILDASLIANEVIDAWQKREEKGLICKLDIEKAYDSLNWQFFMKVMKKMGFGSSGWVGCRVAYPQPSFQVLVNGVPAGFFPSSKGLRQGDPLSPYLFVMGMEVLSTLIRRVVEGGFLPGCRIRGSGRQSVHISHLLFANDAIVFYEARKEHLTHLSWILFWFEVASGLRINLDKSEIIPVGEVEEMEEMAAELGCRVGSMPSVYLGLPLGPPNKGTSVWDGVEERVRRRLALWKTPIYFQRRETHSHKEHDG